MLAKRTTIYLDEKDRRGIKVMQERYGLATLSDVIRFAIRVLSTLPAEREQVLVRPGSWTQQRLEAMRDREAFTAKAKRISVEAEYVITQAERYLREKRIKSTTAPINMTDGTTPRDL